MTTESTQFELQAMQLFEASLDIPKEQRSDWLTEQTGKNTKLRNRVLQLLEKDEISENVMHTGKVDVDSDTIDMPEKIGAYKIIKLIGQGGMGAVYKGKRDSGDFEHDVAIKVIRTKALPEKLIERFERERQTLAQLNHPNIARLYDGGQTPQKMPYFMMEYIDGLPLTKWCEQQNLSDSTRIQLLIKACEAVRYAHQNLIIHRDITPSNVLVDKAGEVKLIDFGIAKPTSTRSDNVDASSSLASMSFTPGFAAPERATGDGNNTLVDIYSLGKLLEAIFKQRSIPKELQAIINQATAALPQHRFQTVNALIVELENYLQQFPVTAYSTSNTYKFSKFIKRHTKASMIAGLALVAILSALGTSIYQYQRAEQNLVQAQARFDDVRALAKYQIFDLYDNLKRVAGNTSIRADLAHRGQQYLANLSKQANASAELKLETAQGYIRLARIFGVPAEPNLGDVTISRANLSTAQVMLDELLSSAPNLPDVKATKVELMAAQGMILVHDDSDLVAAQQTIAQGRKILESVPHPKRSELWYLAQRSLLYTDLERADQAGDSQYLRENANRLREDTQQWPKAMQKRAIAKQDQAYSFYWLAMADFIDRNNVEAIQYFREADRRLSALEANQPNDPMLLYLLSWTNYIAYGAAANLHDQKQSVEFLDKATATTEKLKTLQEGDASITRLAMQMREAKSQLLAEMGDFEQAISQQIDIVAEQKRLAEAKPEPSQYSTWAFSHLILAYMYRDVDRLTDACISLETAERLLRPFVANKQLSGYMYNAATRLPSAIEKCRNGEDLPTMKWLLD
ncbi:serine/threonine protein kinase [Aliiglaciecola aliphaticivorans]